MTSPGAALHDLPDPVLEAAYYDWHNANRLRDQRQDVGFWAALTKTVARVLVLGAGTGRVAVPLAHAGRKVTAVDLSSARLAVISACPNLSAVCGDMRRLPLTDARFDAAVVPYSTFQALPDPADRTTALAEAARVLMPGGTLHLDVSTSFDVRPAVPWRLVLSAPFPPTDVIVEEWERSTQYDDHVLLEKSFRSQGRVLLQLTERWAHFHALNLETNLPDAGFTITKVDHGYGTPTHRRIYHCALRPRENGERR
jgi:ubiquinone/menaquinone biosynthesis C-methylase UbiE